MMRPFTAVWRGCDPLLSLILLGAVSAVVLFARDLPWRGEWMWTLDWAAGTTILLGPLTAAVAAYQSARWRALTIKLLLPTARRRLAACFTPTVAVLASATVVYVIGTVLVLAITSAYHPTDRFQPAEWLIGLTKLGLCAALGWVLGSRLQAYVTASVAVAACYALTVAASGSSALAFWRLGGSTGPSSGTVIDDRYTGGAALLFIGLSGALAASFLIQRAPTRRVAQVTASLSAALATAGLLLCSGPGTTYSRVDTHPHRLCRGAPVSVCLLAGNTSQLGPWSQLMNQAAGGLQDLGLDGQTRYEQPAPGPVHAADVGIVFFDPGTINITPPSHLYVAESLATPATCPAFASERPPVQALNAREWLAQLIVQRVWPDDPSHQDPRVAVWARTTPIADQNRWVRMTFAGLRRCALSAIDVPVAS
ncbi:MAG: hypothetical protein ACJ71T_06745 [Actinomycetales bacterium]